MRRCENSYVSNRHIVGVIRDHLPHGRVLHRYSLHQNMLAMVEDDELRPGMPIPQNAMIFDATRLEPPAFARSINHAITRDCYVIGIGRTHERLQIRKMKLSLGWIILMIGGTEQGRALIEMESNIALQNDRGTEICACCKTDGSASSARACINRRLNCDGVFGYSVSLGAIGPWIAVRGSMGRDR